MMHMALNLGFDLGMLTLIVVILGVALFTAAVKFYEKVDKWLR